MHPITPEAFPRKALGSVFNERSHQVTKTEVRQNGTWVGADIRIARKAARDRLRSSIGQLS